MSEPADDEVARLRRRTAALEAKESGPRKHRVRSFFAVVLVLIAAVLTPLGVIASWTDSQITDTDRYVATMTPPATDPAITDGITGFVHTQVQNVGIVAAPAAWLSGSGRRAGRVRSLWSSGIGAVRQTADRIGTELGPVGPFVRRWKAWLGWGAVGAAALTLVLWSYPTGMVVVWPAIALVGVPAVIEFLDGPRPGPSVGPVAA